MTRSRTHWISFSVLGALLSLALAPAAKPATAAAPIEVIHTISIRNGDWTPLPPEDMRRAAVDPALARLSDAGRLTIKTGPEGSGTRGSSDRLDIAISLIGPAETVKVTMTLDVAGSPTLVATTAISVRGLDHRGIYEAFEHVGSSTADRLVAKLDHVAANPTPDVSPATPEPSSPAADPHLRQLYANAQSAKRTGRYAEARAGFESVVDASPDPKSGLGQLAADELRYGLPVYEAQQAYNEFAGLSRPGQTRDRVAALDRVENLYREIEAENQHDFTRVAEAQRAIDGVLLARRAFANAVRATVMARSGSIRVEIMQYVMMEGSCPGEAFVQEILSRRPYGLALEGLSKQAPDEVRYRLVEAESGVALVFLCTPDGVELAEATESRLQDPAALP